MSIQFYKFKPQAYSSKGEFAKYHLTREDSKCCDNFAFTMARALRVTLSESVGSDQLIVFSFRQQLGQHIAKYNNVQCLERWKAK